MAPAKHIAATSSAVVTTGAGSLAAGYLVGYYAAEAVLRGITAARRTPRKDRR